MRIAFHNGKPAGEALCAQRLLCVADLSLRWIGSAAESDEAPVSPQYNPSALSGCHCTFHCQSPFVSVPLANLLH